MFTLAIKECINAVGFEKKLVIKLVISVYYIIIQVFMFVMSVTFCCTGVIPHAHVPRPRERA